MWLKKSEELKYSSRTLNSKEDKGACNKNHVSFAEELHHAR